MNSELLSSLDPEQRKSLEERPEDSAWEQFKQSFFHEGREQVRALAQTVGAAGSFDPVLEPAEAQSGIGRNAQMAGRAAADVVPIIVTGIAVRAGFGKLIAKSAEPGLLLQRSSVGLNPLESATTGLLTGSLLRPSDAASSVNLASFLEDRAKGGVSSALSFTAFTGINALGAKLGERAWTPIRATLASPIGNGLLTGPAAGLANAEIDSVIREGRFTTDGAAIGKSMYEMTMLGGAFGAFNSAAKYRNQLIESRESRGPQVSNSVPDEQPFLTKIGKSVFGKSISSLDPRFESMALPESGVPLGSQVKSASVSGGWSGPKAETQISPIAKLFGPSESSPLALGGDSVSGKFVSHEMPAELVGKLKIPQSVQDLIAKGEAEKAKSAQQLKDLETHFGADSKEMEILRQQHPLTITDIKRFVEGNPERRKSTVSEQLLSGKKISTSELRSFEILEDESGADPATIARIKQLPSPLAVGVVEYLEDTNHEARLRQVQQLVQNNAHQLEFQPEIMSAMETFSRTLGADSPAMNKIVQYKDEWLDQVRKYDVKVHSGDGAWIDHSPSHDGNGRPLFNEELIGGLSEFLNAFPHEGSVVARELSNGAGPEKLNYDRLATIRIIEHAFGDDSPTTLKLKEMESPNFDLTKLERSVVDHRSIVEKLVQAGASAEDLNYTRVHSHAVLTSSFGESSPVLKRLLEREREGLDLEQPAKFLESKGITYLTSYADHYANSEKPHNRAIALVDRLVTEDAPMRELDAVQLQARLGLEESSKVSKRLLNQIVQFSREHDVWLSNFANMSAPDGRLAGLLKLIGNVLNIATKPSQVTNIRVNALGDFLHEYKSEKLDLANLMRLQDDGLDLKKLSLFVATQKSQKESLPISERPKAWVKQLIDDGASAVKLDASRLTGLQLLNREFGPDSPVVKRILEVETDPNLLDHLSRTIKMPGAPALLERLTSEGANEEQLGPARIDALLGLEKVFKPGSHYMNRLLEAEKTGAVLADVNSFFQGNMAPGMPDPGESMDSASAKPTLSRNSLNLVEKTLDGNIDPTKLSFSYLSSRQRMHEYLGADSPTMKRVLEMERQGLDLVKLREFIDEDIKDHKLMVQSLVDAGASPSELAYSRLRGLSLVIRELKPEQQMYDHLLSLEKQGLRISELAQYLQEDQKERVPQINAMLERGAGIQEMNIKRLADAAVVNKMKEELGDNEPAMKYIAKLQNDGLSASRLMRFIQDNPASRKDLVLKLIEEHADVARFNKQMSLSVFPDDVAYPLLKTAMQEDKVNTPMFGYLRNWNNGSKFRDAVIDHVRSGKPGTAQALRALYDEVREQASESDKSVTATDQSISSNSRPEPSVETNQQSRRGEEIAQVVKSAVDAINKDIPKNTPIVLLGRDNWLLLPALRAEGRPVQYFLWSRLQGNDARTGAQWLKEVPPNAAVIDTGYSGTILNYIKKIDPSASGYLLSSGGKYPQLLKRGDHAGMVQAIEYFPKLVARSKTYTEKGGAVSKRGDRDSDEEIAGSRELNHRWFVQGANVDMLRASGLREWDVWRFSDYVGLTPKERLQLNSNEELQRHYEQVERARQKPTSTPGSAR